jgi:polar amino acid transport system substrate-binding protein
MRKKIISTVLIAVIAVSVVFWVRHFSHKDNPRIPTTLQVVTTADYPPMSFKQDGKIIGFDIDVVTEIARRLGKQIEIKDVLFEALIPYAKAERAQIIAAGLAPTPDRQKEVDFTPPYLTSDQLAIITLSSKSAPAGTKDLEGKRVVVNTGYNADAYLTKLSGIAIIRIPTLADAVNFIKIGEADAFVTARHTVGQILAQYGKENFNVTFIPDAAEDTALGISKAYPHLQKMVSETLLQMITDGTIEQLKQKWHVQ